MNDTHAQSDKPLGPGALPRTVGIELPTNEIAAALAAAQANITSPPRNRTVQVQGKTPAGKIYNYKFRYATLDSIIDHIREALTDNELWFTQTLGADNGKYRLITKLLHSSGQSIVSETPLLVDGASNQAFGSALTYMRRYALTAMLGIAADEDDDANAADGNTITDAKGPKASASKSWHGPLTITHLKTKMRNFAGGLPDNTDINELTGFLNDNQEVLDQCMRDLPEWYYGSVDEDGNVSTPGAQARIEEKKDELEERAALQAPPPEPPPENEVNPLG